MHIYLNLTLYKCNTVNDTIQIIRILEHILIKINLKSLRDDRIGMLRPFALNHFHILKTHPLYVTKFYPNV